MQVEAHIFPSEITSRLYFRTNRYFILHKWDVWSTVACSCLCILGLTPWKIISLRPKPMSPIYHKWWASVSFVWSALYSICEPTDIFFYTNGTFDRWWHVHVCAYWRTHTINYLYLLEFLCVRDAGSRGNKITTTCLARKLTHELHPHPLPH